MKAHQPGSLPLEIPKQVPNPAHLPQEEPAPSVPAPKEPVEVPEKVDWAPAFRRGFFISLQT